MKKQFIILLAVMIVAAMASQNRANAQNDPKQNLLATVKAVSGKIIHLTERHDDGLYFITAYTENNGKLVEDKAFKVGKSYQSVVNSVEYHIWYSSNPAGGYFAFNKADNTLYLPLIEIVFKNGGIDYKEGYDRYLVYQFDGEHFVYKRKDGGFWLHPSLRKFEALECVGKTKDYLVRIDRTAHGKYRYAAWKNKDSMTDNPDLVIEGGLLNNSIYEFENKGYRYVVDSRGGLMVYHGDKLILNQPLTDITSKKHNWD